MRRIACRLLTAVAVAAVIGPAVGCGSDAPKPQTNGGGKPAPDLELNQGGDAAKGKARPPTHQDSNKERRD